MIQTKKTHRILPGLALYSACGTAAYGQSFSGLTGDTMSFLSWMVLGLVAGFIGSKVIAQGEVRASCSTSCWMLWARLPVAGCSHIFGAPGVSGLNLYSLFVAVIGSVVLLVVYHAVFRRRVWYGA